MRSVRSRVPISGQDFFKHVPSQLRSEGPLLGRGTSKSSGGGEDRRPQKCAPFRVTGVACGRTPWSQSTIFGPSQDFDDTAASDLWAFCLYTSQWLCLCPEEVLRGVCVWWWGGIYCVHGLSLCTYVHVSLLVAINQYGFGRVKSTNCAHVSSLFQQLSFSGVITETERASLAHPVCLSVFLIGVQHPPTSCQERAPSPSPEPANYCLGWCAPQGPQSDIQNLPEGSAQ